MKATKAVSDILCFLRIHFLALRVEGTITTLVSLVIPLGILAMVSFMGAMKNHEFANQMVSGNLTLIISQSCIVFLASSINQLKMQGGLEQYSVFPIFRLGLILSYVLFRMLLLIPYIIILLSFSIFVFNARINLHPLLIPVLLLASITFSSIGVLIGLSSQNYKKTESLINIIMFGVMFLTPLFYSVRVYPPFIQAVQFMLPFTYVVDAFKRLLFFSSFSPRILMDIGVLALYAVVSATVSSFFFSWRAVEKNS